MIRTKDEILASIRTKIGDDTSDEAIALVEDINDSFDDLSTRVAEAGDWKEKYEQNDAEWRKKYTERFFEPSGEDPMQKVLGDLDKEEPEAPKRLTFDDLFKTE